MDLGLLIVKSSLRIKSGLIPTDRHLVRRQAAQRRVVFVI